jgi:hypothetical protein
MISQKTLLEKITPNATGAGYLTVIDLPYPVLNWASSTKVKKNHVIN